MIALDNAFKEIIPSSHLYLPVFYKKLKTVKNSIFSLIFEWSRFFPGNPAVSRSIVYYPLSSCQIFWKSQGGKYHNFLWWTIFCPYAPLKWRTVTCSGTWLHFRTLLTSSTSSTSLTSGLIWSQKFGHNLWHHDANYLKAPCASLRVMTSRSTTSSCTFGSWNRTLSLSTFHY